MNKIEANPLEGLRQLRQEINEKIGPPIAGIVVRSQVWQQIEKLCPQSLNFKQHGVSLYADEMQQEACIVFEDDRLLRAYINRRHNPDAYHQHIATLVGVDKSFVVEHSYLPLSELVAVTQMIAKLTVISRDRIIDVNWWRRA
jgi:hypothetical protein